VGVALAAVLVIVGVIWLFGTLLAGHECSGEGGTPFAARDSAVGGLCESTWHRSHGSTLWGLLLLTPLLVTIAGGVVAIVKRSWRWLVLTPAVAIGLLLLLTLPFFVLPSTCSDADWQRYHAWRAHPTTPRSPVECDHY
jgi:hypothetical protein